MITVDCACTILNGAIGVRTLPDDTNVHYTEYRLIRNVDKLGTCTFPTLIQSRIVSEQMKR